jgi:hypothetical protein
MAVGEAWLSQPFSHPVPSLALITIQQASECGGVELERRAWRVSSYDAAG